MFCFSIYYLFGSRFRGESNDENGNRNNEQHFVEENNNTLVSPNDMN